MLANEAIIKLREGKHASRTLIIHGSHQKGRLSMGEKGGKKDKIKAEKQKQEQLEKKKEQQKNKLPAKKP
jgi:hypothetical protein